jgi:hypothetical protein
MRKTGDIIIIFKFKNTKIRDGTLSAEGNCAFRAIFIRKGYG